MTLRRRTALKPSRGTVIPAHIRYAVTRRDLICVGFRLHLPKDCAGVLELDHVRASGGMGMKSASIPANLVLLCAEHHRYKTEHGREVRPLLIAYIDDATERSAVLG